MLSGIFATKRFLVGTLLVPALRPPEGWGERGPGSSRPGDGGIIGPFSCSARVLASLESSTLSRRPKSVLPFILLIASCGSEWQGERDGAAGRELWANGNPGRELSRGRGQGDGEARLRVARVFVVDECETLLVGDSGDAPKLRAEARAGEKQLLAER